VVRLIGEDGKNKGDVPLKEAIRYAEERGLDLVEVAPDANPPVCKVMDYGKFKYEMKKKMQSAKKKQTTLVVKEIKIRPKIEEHDYQVKLKHIRRFLEEGNKVRVIVMFKGRELIFMDKGLKLVERILKDVEDLGTQEKEPVKDEKTIVLMITPQKKGGKSVKDTQRSEKEVQNNSQGQNQV
jgi:translation initiation factor IF-3